MAEQRQQQAIAEAAATKAAAVAAEARRLAALNAEESRKVAEESRKVAVENERLARIVDDRLRGPYAALAGAIYNALARTGLCVASGSVGQGVSCSTQANYASGDLAPIDLSFNVRRQQFVTLSVSPHNEKRNASFSGATATLTVQSVFETVDVNSPDPVRFHPAIRAMIASMLQAFGVSGQLLDTCRANPQGFSGPVNGAIASCQFVGRPPTNGGLAQFTLNLALRM
jgi:hypothetical protein